MYRNHLGMPSRGHKTPEQRQTQMKYERDTLLVPQTGPTYRSAAESGSTQLWHSEQLHSLWYTPTTETGQMPYLRVVQKWWNGGGGWG